MENAPEFSRPLNTDRVNVGSPRVETITANEQERAALAVRFGLLALDKLTATLTITRLPDDAAVLSVEGTLQAAVVQPCVVTLEPVADSFEEPFETTFAPTAYVERWLADHPDDDLDAPEELVNGYMDMGEITAQYMALALNPYPRKADLDFADDSATLAEEQRKENPFAVLEGLKGGG